MAKMNKSSPEEDGINCLIVGTELKAIYIIDTEAFTILTTVINFKIFYYFKSLIYFKNFS